MTNYRVIAGEHLSRAGDLIAIADDLDNAREQSYPDGRNSVHFATLATAHATYAMALLAAYPESRVTVR
jgi:hypothetical protein